MNRLKEIRQKSGFTQAELGCLLNVQKSAVSKYETGKVPLTDEIISKLVEIFGVSSDYLLCLSDVPALSYWENRISSLSAESLYDLDKYICLLELRESQEKSSSNTVI